MSVVTDAKILIFDADASFAQKMEKTIKDKYTGVESRTEKQAFYDRLRELEPSLIIMDIMINLNTDEGQGVLREIRYLTSAPVLVISRNEDQDTINQSIDLGASDFIAKPMDEFLLFKKVDNLLKNRSDDNYYERNRTAVPDALSKIIIMTEFNIAGINENGIVIKSKNYISKGTLVSLQNDLLSVILEIKGPTNMAVKNVEFDGDSKIYTLNLEFLDEDNSFGNRVRAYVAQKFALKKTAPSVN
jgi:DNA-binding response OmpR family regulator